MAINNTLKKAKQHRTPLWFQLIGAVLAIFCGLEGGSVVLVKIFSQPKRDVGLISAITFLILSGVLAPHFLRERHCEHSRFIELTSLEKSILVLTLTFFAFFCFVLWFVWLRV